MHFYVKSIYLAWYAPGISDAVLFFSFAQVRNDLDPTFWSIDPAYSWHDEGEWYYAVPYVPVNIGNNATADNHIFVYPNPAKDHVTIAGNKIDKVEILTIAGQKIMEKECVNHHITNIDISNLPAGNYIAKISGNGKVVTKKINKL